MGEVLGTGRLPDEIVTALSDCFKVTLEEGVGIPLELCSGRGIHAFFGPFASGVELVLGLDYLALLGVDPGGTVLFLHWFFPVPV